MRGTCWAASGVAAFLLICAFVCPGQGLPSSLTPEERRPVDGTRDITSLLGESGSHEEVVMLQEAVAVRSEDAFPSPFSESGQLLDLSDCKRVEADGSELYVVATALPDAAFDYTLMITTDQSALSEAGTMVAFTSSEFSPVNSTELLITENSACLRTLGSSECLAQGTKQGWFQPVDGKISLTVMRTGSVFTLMDAHGDEILRFKEYGVPSFPTEVGVKSGVWNFCLVKTKYATPECFCEHGAPVDGADCKSYMHGTHRCATCNEGHYMSRHHVCLLSKCRCLHGDAALGSDCEENDHTKCVVCDHGYHLEGDTCEPNVCKCEGGIAGRGPDTCDLHGANYCQECETGRELIKNGTMEGYCLPTHAACKCPNGAPKEGKCQHGVVACGECADGYFLYKDAVPDVTCEKKECECENGMAAKGRDCASHGQAWCTGCELGYVLNNGVCDLLRCTCENGVGGQGIQCLSQGTASCTSCDAGYVWEAGACVANQCTCNQGQPVNSSLCTTSDHDQCASCNEGYYLGYDQKCMVNVCTCDNGAGAVATRCEKTDTEHCVHCNPGFRLVNIVESTPGLPAAETFIDVTTDVTSDLMFDSEDRTADLGEVAGNMTKKPARNSCAANVCTCNGGVPIQGPECVGDGRESCDECDQFHTLMGEKCFPNQCHCEAGTAANSTSCVTDGSEQCVVCKEGFHLTDTMQCLENKCQCEGGVASTGADCTVHGEAGCMYCTTPGFSVQDSQCKIDICTCPHGIGSTGADCPVHGEHNCDSCFDGFDLQMAKDKLSCVTKQCTCKYGRAANGTLCPTSGEENCIECDDHYTMVGDECVLKLCTCNDGVPAMGNACSVHGTMQCAACVNGFHLDGTHCKLNSCSCNNGIQAVGRECSADGSEQCTSCDRGFHITDGMKCEQNVCTCQHGTPESGKACREHSTARCASCDHGYEINYFTYKCTVPMTNDVTKELLYKKKMK